MSKASAILDRCVELTHLAASVYNKALYEFGSPKGELVFFLNLLMRNILLDDGSKVYLHKSSEFISFLKKHYHYDHLPRTVENLDSTPSHMIYEFINIWE